MVQVCFNCMVVNAAIVQPLVHQRQDAGQPADRSGGRQQAAQQVRPQLALRPTDHGSQARQAPLGAQFMAGGEQLPALGGARGPSRGKGKQAVQPRKRKGESDEDYDDSVERRQRQPGPGRRSGRYGLPQGDGSDSDSLGRLMRRRPAAQRKQAANVSLLQPGARSLQLACCCVCLSAQRRRPVGHCRWPGFLPCSIS